MRLVYISICLLFLGFQESDPLSDLENLIVDLTEESKGVRIFEPQDMPETRRSLYIKQIRFAITIKSKWHMFFREDTTSRRVYLNKFWKDNIPHIKNVKQFKEFAGSTWQWKGNCDGCAWGDYKQVWFVVRRDEKIIDLCDDLSFLVQLYQAGFRQCTNQIHCSVH